jgi:hypothetical protein
MSRVGSGDASQKPENENENHFRTGFEVRDMSEKADMNQMNVVDSSHMNTGRTEGNLHKMTHGDM